MSWHISPAGDVTIIGRNAEMADMNNPDGNLYGEVVYLTATNEQGERYNGPTLGVRKRELSEEDISKRAADTQELVDRGELDPANHPEWQPGRPVYGSTAYERSGQEAQDALQERRNG